MLNHKKMNGPYNKTSVQELCPMNNSGNKRETFKKIFETAVLDVELDIDNIFSTRNPSRGSSKRFKL